MGEEFDTIRMNIDTKNIIIKNKDKNKESNKLEKKINKSFRKLKTDKLIKLLMKKLESL